MSNHLSANTSKAGTELSVDNPDPNAIEIGGTEQQKVDHAANKGAERANDRINADKGKVPGTSIFTK